MPNQPRKRLTPQEAAQELLNRRKARTSFLEFVKYTFPKEYSVAPHIERICNALDKVASGEIRKLLIEAPPRHGKSELVSRRFPAYWMGRNPAGEIISTSYNTRLAAGFGRFNRNLIGSQRYRNVFYDTKISADSRANDLWHTTEGGVYLATGVDAGQTGWGANIYIFDDLLKGIKEADSESIKKAKWEWYLSEAYTRQMPNFAQVMMATRWAVDDPSGRALETQSEDSPWVRLKFPAIYNEGTEYEKALHPERYSLEKLREIRVLFTQGGRQRMWKALYQQEPTVESGDFIQRVWFNERYTVVPAPLNIYIASDYAVTEPEEGEDPDYTEHGVFGIDPTGQLVVLDWWSGRTTADVWVEALIDLIKKWEPICVYGETGPIRRAVEPWMEKRFEEEHIHVWTEWIPSVRDKATRARPFQAMAARKRVLFGKQTWAHEVVEQCVLFPGARHDDKFDVMSLICQAIHMNHAAIVDAEQVGDRGRWGGYDDDFFEDENDESWRTA